MMSKNRSAYWDNIKGVLIFLVVFAHCLYDFQDNETIEAIVQSIYLFHMPAFIFVSGYFGKSEKAHSSKSILTLLFAYFVFNSITGLIMGWDDFLNPNYSYWYIMALVLWRIAAKYIPANGTSLLVSLVACIAVGFIPEITNTLALSRTIAFFPFYLAGLMLPKGSFEATQKRFLPGLAALAVAVIVAYIVIIPLDFDTGVMLMDAYSEASRAIERLCVIVCASAATFAVLAFAPRKEIPLLTSFGRNSLPIFLLHRLITLAFSSAVAGQRALVILPGAVLLSILICLAFGNDKVGKFISRYLEDGAELVMGQRAESKRAAEYTAVALSALAVIAAMIIDSCLNM